MAKKYAVILREGAREHFAPSIAAHLKVSDGQDYFLATQIDPNGRFFMMELEFPYPSGQTGALEVLFPAELVAYTLVSADLKKMGF